MARTEKELDVVADAGPLIHLDELGVIEVLKDFREVHVPNAVWMEVARHRPAALEGHKCLWRRAPPVTIVDPVLSSLASSFALDRGEIEAIHLMGLHPSAMFLTDDTAARLAASRMRFRVHGTIGVLLRSVRRGHLPPGRAEDLLRSIPHSSTLHIRRDLLEEVIAELRNTFP